MVDVLVETKFNNIPGYIYVLVEHQSKPDEIMPLRIWSYLLKIMEYHITKNNTKVLPTVYPIIFYNGKRKYNYSTNLLDLFANKALAKRVLGDLAPVQLTELNKIPDAELAILSHYYSLAVAMKHIYDRDPLAIWKLVLPATYHGAGNTDTFLTVAEYLMVVRKIETEDFRRIIDEADLPKDYKEEAMTLADKLRQEGMQEGMQKGRQEGRQEGKEEGIQEERIKLIKNLLAAGMSIEQIALATKLTSCEVERLALMNR